MAHDPHLGSGPSDDSEFSGNDSDSASLFSEDSVFPYYEREETVGGTTSTLYQACARNQVHSLRRVLDRGVAKEEAMELDLNGRTGLMLAVSRGYVDIVYGLHTCPHIDINHQDNEGNTALMIAAQAGFSNILNYILNYFPAVDMEVRDVRGFTALIKAAMQGREACVSALLMHGADINAVDSTRGKGIKDWALKTGRYEILRTLHYLSDRPVAQQFCESYVCEWPDLKGLVAKATARKSPGQKITRCLKDNLTVNLPRDPQDNGVLEHMVRMTTGIYSPLVVTGCRPLCPSSPPELGKRRLTVTRLMETHTCKELEESSVCHSDGHSVCSAAASLGSSNSSGSLASRCVEWRDSLISMASDGMKNVLPRRIAYRNSVFPSGCIPRIQVTRASDPTPKKVQAPAKHKGYLEPPLWKYKEAKVEKKTMKKKAEEEKIAQEKKDRKAKKKATKYKCVKKKSEKK